MLDKLLRLEVFMRERVITGTPLSFVMILLAPLLCLLMFPVSIATFLLVWAGWIGLWILFSLLMMLVIILGMRRDG